MSVTAPSAAVPSVEPHNRWFEPALDTAPKPQHVLTLGCLLTWPTMAASKILERAIARTKSLTQREIVRVLLAVVHTGMTALA